MEQHAFIKCRNISDMLREIDDIMKHSKSEKASNIILSFYYANAFDTISTEAILKALKYFGLGNYFIKWTEILFYNSESCVRNGVFFI